MYFEVYDTETRNLLVDTQTLSEALAIVRATVGKHGPATVATWTLVEDDAADSESGRPIATGDVLARLAVNQQATAIRSHD
ncbi:MAG: hypothetical protein ACR2M3_21635 [Thermomicrobiales bacterium]